MERRATIWRFLRKAPKSNQKSTSDFFARLGVIARADARRVTNHMLFDGQELSEMISRIWIIALMYRPLRAWAVVNSDGITVNTVIKDCPWTARLEPRGRLPDVGDYALHRQTLRAIASRSQLDSLIVNMEVANMEVANMEVPNMEAAIPYPESGLQR